MSKKFFKAVGVGAMCLAGALGLSACGGKDNKAKIVSIDVLENTIPAEIISGEFDNQNIVLKVCYDDGTEKLVTIKTSDIPSEYRDSLLLPGTHTVKVNYGGFEDDMTLTISLSSEKVATMLKNAYDYVQTHDHEEQIKFVEKNVSGSSSVESTEKSQEYEMLYNYNPTNQQAEVLATLGDTKTYVSTEKAISVSNNSLVRYNNEKINTFRQNDFSKQSIFAYVSELFDSRCTPTTLLASDSEYSVHYDAKIVNGAILYTAEFESQSMKFVYTFDSEKIVDFVITETEIDETSVNTYTSSFAVTYREVADSETSENLVDMSTLNNGVESIKQSLQALKEYEFTLIKKVGIYVIGLPAGVSPDATTYTHTADSETLTNGDDSVNLFEIVPLFENYLDANYYELSSTETQDKYFSVITDSLLSIRYYTENDKLTTIEVYDLNSDLYYEISINY